MPTRRVNEQTYEEIAIVAAQPIPVDVGGASINFTGNVTLGAVTVNNANSAPVPISDAGGSVTIDDGNGSITVDGPLTDSQLRSQAVVVNVQATVLPSGAATAGNQVIGNASLAAVDGKLPALTNGRIPVDNSGVVQPISDNNGSITVDDGGGSLTVDGPLTNAELRAVPVSVLGPVTDAQLRASPVPIAMPAMAATTTSVNSTTSSQLILGGNANRKGFMIDNMSEQSLYLSFENPATLSNSFKRVFPNSFFAFDQRLYTTQAIYGTWSAANGRAAVTEFV